MSRLDRRTFLRASGAAGLALFVPFTRPGGVAVAVEVSDEPTFLTVDELETLRAAVDRFIPGRPEDADPGAVEAGCAEAIDALLGAFEFDPPRIYAGAPYSDRGGHPVNHFEDFLPLDGYEAMAWRLRIEGSGGRPELEFNGPVTGYQAIYRDGLEALDEAVPGDGRFADMPGPTRDLILRHDDERIESFVDIAFPHTLEFMYGAPEYGGNRDLIGWEYTDYMGDVQPRGWTREEVENPDDEGPPELTPDLPAGWSDADLAALAPLAFPELTRGLLARRGGSLSGLRDQLAVLLDASRDGGPHGR